MDRLRVVGPTDPTAGTVDVRLDASGTVIDEADGLGDVVEFADGVVRDLSMPGEVTFENVRACFPTCAQARPNGKRPGGSAGCAPRTVRVAAFQSVAFAFVPSVLTNLAIKHPRLRVDFEVREPDDAIAGLLAHDLDLIVDEEFPGEPIAPDDRLDRELMLDDPLLLVVPASWGPVHDLADLEDRPWTLEPSGTRGRAWAETFFREHGFQPEVPFGFNDLAMRCRMIETGHAAALLTDLASINDGGRLTSWALPGDPTRRICTVVRRSAARHPVSIALRLAFSRAVDERRLLRRRGEVRHLRRPE